MNFFADALAWIFDGANWLGETGLGVRVLQHLWISLVVLCIAAVIALPLGAAIGFTGRGRQFVIMLSGALRALPTLGALTLIALWLGIGIQAPVIVLVILAIPPLLAGAYAGFEAVDRQVLDAARAMGMKTRQLIFSVSVPLSSSVVLGGVRAASLQVVATAVLAAYVSDSGLGRPIFEGLKTRGYTQMIGVSLILIALALALDLLLATLQRLAVPKGVRILQQ